MRYAAFRTLETPRLILRALSREDIPAYYARLGSSEDVTRYMLFQPHRDISESVASIEKAICRYETGKCYRWAITLKESNELIGILEPLRFDEEKDSCSFAYMLGKDFWGRGYATEALKAVFHFLFTEMGIQRVEADHMAANPASGAVMRKCGMVFQGIRENAYEKNGIKQDAILYAITREQWTNPEQKDRKIPLSRLFS